MAVPEGDNLAPAAPTLAHDVDNNLIIATAPLDLQTNYLFVTGETAEAAEDGNGKRSARKLLMAPKFILVRLRKMWRRPLRPRAWMLRTTVFLTAASKAEGSA
jgi:hypothetical protein